MNGMIERATEMPNVNNVASDTMDEEDVKALVLSLEKHGVEHQKTKAIMDRIEKRVGAEKAAVLKARAKDRAFGMDKEAPRSQRPAGGGTGDRPEKSGKATESGEEDRKKEFRGRQGQGAPLLFGDRDTDPKTKTGQPRATGGGTVDAEKQGATAPSLGRGRGDMGR